MHREVITALIPATIALLIGFALLRGVLSLSRAKLDLKRLLRLHRCQHGGVQSLSFVLTLPLFVMLVLFIVQVSQLMVGIMAVHHAAFAAARAIIVWTPAHFRDASSGYAEEIENVLPQPVRESEQFEIAYQSTGVSLSANNASASYKLNKVFGAAVLGVAPAAPGRPLVEPINCPSCGVQPNVVADLYRLLVPTSATNPKIPQRLQNKLAYAYWNTVVDIAFLDKDTRDGPTYNPRVLRVVDGVAVTDINGEFVRDWGPNEVGWQDPIFVRVTHDFALLPGPGRFLARYIVGGDGRRDEVAPRITRQTASFRVPFLEPVHTTRISANVTLTNEGFKPLLDYLEDVQ